MLRALWNRVVYSAVVLLLLATCTFFLVRVAPGGPFSAERAVSPEVEAALRARYGLDRPLVEQYVRMLWGVVRLDFGPSMKHQDKTVAEIIVRHLPASLLLGVVALCLALWVGLTVGVVCAMRANRLVDYLGMSGAALGISLPTFVFGPFLQMVFAMRWGWVPVAGYGELKHLVLPALTLALPFAARFARLMRAGMLEVLSEDFVRTARAKGASESVVVWRHALRGAVLPVVSFVGPAFASMATGSLVVEKIFGIPGLGREFVEGALSRDYTLVMGTTLVYGAFIVVFNLIADMTYRVLDPRVRGGL